MNMNTPEMASVAAAGASSAAASSIKSNLLQAQDSLMYLSNLNHRLELVATRLGYCPAPVPSCDPSMKNLTDSEPSLLNATSSLASSLNRECGQFDHLLGAINELLGE